MANGIFTPNTQFNWIGQNKAHTNKSKEDISISKVESKGKILAAITVRNHCWELLSSTDFVMVTEPIKNRIYFKGSTANDGLLMCKNSGSTSGNRYIRITSPSKDKFFDFVGHYELKYDAFNELYYIEKGEE